MISRSDPAKAKLDDALPGQGRRGVDRRPCPCSSPSPATRAGPGAARRRHTAHAQGRGARRRRDRRAGAAQARRPATASSSVGPVQFKQTGQPLGDPDPLSTGRPTQGASCATAARAQRQARRPLQQGAAAEGLELRAAQEAQRPRRQDAQLHRAPGTRATPARASTVGVLDGGTDFGHPDLIGTWQTWSGAQTPAPPTTAGTAGRRRSTRTARCSLLLAPGPGRPAACPGTRRRRAAPCPGDGTASCRVDVRHAHRPVAQLRPRRPARRQPQLPLPARVDEVGHGAARQPPRRLPARSLRGAPGVPRRRRQDSRRLRHGLRRPRRRLRLRRREAGHEELARVVPRHERRRLHRPLRRPRSTTSPTARPTIPGGLDEFGDDAGAGGRRRCSPGAATSTRASRATAR